MTFLAKQGLGASHLNTTTGIGFQQTESPLDMLETPWGPGSDRILLRSIGNNTSCRSSSFPVPISSETEGDSDIALKPRPKTGGRSVSTRSMSHHSRLPSNKPRRSLTKEIISSTPGKKLGRCRITQGNTGQQNYRFQSTFPSKMGGGSRESKKRKRIIPSLSTKNSGIFP